MDANKTYVIQDSLGHKLENSSRLMGNRLNKLFKERDLPITAEQWAVLSLLSEEDGLSQNHLAQSVGKDHTSVSRLLDNLNKNGLIKRVTDAKDRRLNLIYLTAQGKRLKLDATAIVQEHLTTALRGLAPDEIQQCASLLDRIIHNLT